MNEARPRWVLLGLGGLLEGRQWPITETLVLGRDPTCDVVLPQAQVSRRHARLTLREDAVWVEDLGSKNGTFLNGERLPAHTPLPMKEGDILAIALAQRFTLMDMGVTQTQPVSPESALWHPEAKFPARRLVVDMESHRVWVLGKEVQPPFSPMQFRLLAALYMRQGEVVPKDVLMKAIWGAEALWVTQQALDVLIHRVRERLAEYDPEHNYLVTLRGQGLRLDNPPWTPPSSED